MSLTARTAVKLYNRLIATSYRGEEATAARGGGEICYLSGGGGRTVVGIVEQGVRGSAPTKKVGFASDWAATGRARQAR